MGVILVGMLIAAAGMAPADGHSVVALPRAHFDSELRCEGPLEGRFLAPANLRGGLGVRAPAVPGRVSCRLRFAKGKDFPFVLNFTAPPGGLAVGAIGPVTLGQDKEALLKVTGTATRADGSAGPATVGDGRVSAPLPTSKMPQNLLVLVEDAKGNAAYTVVPLLGRASVKVQTARDASVEAVVAGHRTLGFTSDATGQVVVAVPSPPGFVKGVIDVASATGRTTRAPIGLPAAKPLHALAALGPDGPVAPGALAEFVVAGVDPLGLPPKPLELKASVSSGKLVGVAPLRPGLWRVRVQTGAAGEGKLELNLGSATRTVVFAVGAPTPAPGALQTPPILAVEPEPAPKAPEPTATPALPVPTQAEVVTRTDAIKPAESARPAPALAEVTQSAPARRADGVGGVRLELLAEAGYLTNGGALAGIAPGAQVQVAYRLADIDVGGGFDLLYAIASRQNQVASGSGTIDARTSVQSLQLLVGPWVRYRVTDLIGVDLTAGLGLSHTTEQIESGGQTATFGPVTPLAFGGMGGLDLNLGAVRAFAGVRYVSASASGTLTGPAGGLAALAGVGVDLGL
jgi:hypothetical protein